MISYVIICVVWHCMPLSCQSYDIMRCICGNWAWWSKSNLWTSSRRNLQNIRSGWGKCLLYTDVLWMSAVQEYQLRLTHRSWKHMKCHETTMNLRVYILKLYALVLVWSRNTLEYAGSTSRINGWWHVSKQRAPASFLVNGYMFEALMMDCYLSLSLNKE